MSDEAILHLTEEQLTFFADRERAVGYREGHRAALSQRTWVGLTTDEMKEIADRYHLKPPNIPVAFRAIEAKLKEKNT